MLDYANKPSSIWIEKSKRNDKGNEKHLTQETLPTQEKPSTYNLNLLDYPKLFKRYNIKTQLFTIIGSIFLIKMWPLKFGKLSFLFRIEA
jgi:hypothetical protein